MLNLCIASIILNNLHTYIQIYIYNDNCYDINIQIYYYIINIKSILTYSPILIVHKFILKPNNRCISLYNNTIVINNVI